MNKINWKQKLSSRKLWAAVAGIVTGLAMVFGLDEGTMTNVAGAVVSLSSIVAYIIAEGDVDAARVKQAAQDVQKAVEAVKVNKKPVSYLQTDKRWKDKPYQVKGETATIGGSGCGPTAAAMLIETLTGQTFTPVDACKWSVDHGYKALNAGTYYGYFAPQFAAFGIKCWQLSWTNAYHNPKSKVHDQALEYLKQGYYLIALMKKGTWTGGGHFIVVWWADDKIRINDPASTKDKRLNGDPATFRNEAAYYWVVDARAHNGATDKEDDDMDQDKFNKMFATAMQQYRQELRDNDCSEWSREARKFAVEQGIFAGGGTDAAGQPNYMWEDLLTREQCAQVLYAFATKFGLA